MHNSPRAPQSKKVKAAVLIGLGDYTLNIVYRDEEIEALTGG